MKSHPIALTYAYPIAFTAAVFALCHWGWGDSGAVLFRKVFFAPMFLLAGRGLRTYFTWDNDRTRSTATQAEFQFLTALTVSGFVLSIGPFEANSFGRSIALLLIMAAAMTILNMGFFLFGRRKSPPIG
jgi:hypothetical protein